VLVIDTNVWISYLLITPSTFGQKLDQVLKQDAYAFSEATFTELAEVLMRPKFARFSSDATRRDLLKKTAMAAEWFMPEEIISACSDPNDDKFLELAVAASAGHILTGDEDLLCLDPFRNIRITTVASFQLDSI